MKLLVIFLSYSLVYVNFKYYFGQIMQALVEHYSMKGWLQRIEQCVLHMDISSLDFNQVLLVKKKKLFK